MATERSKNTSLHLHPMVLMNTSDHLTRFELSGKRERVVGLLFGCQKGLSVHIFDSFEFEYKKNEQGVFELDRNFVIKKKEHYTAVFPNYEILGWYTVGEDVSDEDMIIHKAISEFNESPLMLLLNANIPPQSKELPVKVLEAVFQVINDAPTMIFVDVEFHIDTTEAERGTVEFIVKKESAMQGSLVQHIGELHNSIGMLSKRVQLIERYLRLVRDGEIQKDHHLLREVAAICNMLPIADSRAFEANFATELNDCTVLSYLSAVTKGMASLHAVQKKIDLSNEIR